MSCNYGCKKNFLPMSRKDVQRESPEQTEQLHKPKYVFSSLRKIWMGQCKLCNTKGFCLEVEKALPIVVAVTLARRPSIQENGRDMAMAPDPILETCPTRK